MVLYISQFTPYKDNNSYKELPNFKLILYML